MLLRRCYSNNSAMIPDRSIGYASTPDKTRSEVSTRFGELSGAHQPFWAVSEVREQRVDKESCAGCLQLEKPSNHMSLIPIDDRGALERPPYAKQIHPPARFEVTWI